MTRGETVRLIYLLSTQEYQVIEPPILSELKIENPQGLDLNGYQVWRNTPRFSYGDISHN